MSEHRSDDTDILIVGAGPAGLVMSLCLAKLGIASVIVERNGGINEHPKAHELNARSIEILAMLGITQDEMAVEASPPEDGCRIAFSMRIKEEFGSIDLLHDIDDPEKYARHLASPLPYLNISQTEVERILFERVKADPLIDLKLGHQWQSHQDDRETVRSVILDRSSEEEFVIQSRFLIAADGAGSRIRKALNIAMVGPDKLQDLVGVCFEAGLRDFVKAPAKLYWIMEPDAFGTLIAHHVDRRWVFHVPIYEPWESPEDYSEQVLLERVKRAFGTDTADITIKSSSVWRMAMQVAERWRGGSVFLVGDAAHRFPPTGGLGMNTGIADAHNLAWKMAAFLRGDCTGELLDTYEIERRPISVRNGEESLANFERMFDVIEALGAPRNGGEKMAKLKNSSLFRMLPKSWSRALTSWLQSTASKKMRGRLADAETRKLLQETVRAQIPHFDRIGLDIGYIYEEGALVRDGKEIHHPDVTRYQPSTVPGSRFPHLWLQNESGEYSSHALLSYNQWTMICAGSQSGGAEEVAGLPINVVPVDRLNADSSSRERLKNLCEIGEKGAILIRPDGHVAWRSSTKIDVKSESFATALEHCGLAQASQAAAIHAA